MGVVIFGSPLWEFFGCFFSLSLLYMNLCDLDVYVDKGKITIFLLSGFSIETQNTLLDMKVSKVPKGKN